MTGSLRALLAAPLLAATTLLAAPAQAGPHDFIVYIARLGGDTETAKPYIAKFAAQIEKRMGWKKGTTSGAFFADRKDALAYIQKTQPGFGLLDPPLYFERRTEDALTLVGQLQSTELVSTKLHVVVKNPKLTSLAELKGKQLWTTLAESPRFLSRVAFDGKLDVEKELKLKRVGTALKGLRAVLRGQADATLIDDDQLAAAKKIEGGNTLKSIYTSPALPPLPVVAFGKVMKPAEAKALEKTLPKICTGEGAPICKELHLPPFQPPKPALFKPTQDRYER